MKIRSLFGVALAAAWLCVCSAPAADSLLVHSFEEETLPAELRVEGATAEVVQGTGVTAGDRALRVVFPADTSDAGVQITPTTPWDCRPLGECHLAFDATNVGDSSLHLRCNVTSRRGVVVRRTACLPEGETRTFYFPLSGPEAAKDHGMRDDPAAFAGVGHKLLLSSAKWGGNIAQIKSVSLYVLDTASEDAVVFDNLRLAPNPTTPSGYLDGIVDRFGQSSRAEFDEKVRSEDELRVVAEEELAQLAAGGPLADRGRFGGWRGGPRLDATGYFRAEKIGEKWALVDPEGYLYFATGIDNLRMANTSTFTGIDFKDPSVRYRDPEDVTPEDSIGIVPSSAEARATAYVAYPERRRMFEWLPDYNHPLAKHYGYRRSAHLGPFPHGEVFSFYLANLERRYGVPASGDRLEVWRRVTIDRMLDWGFTSLGNWTDASFYQNDRVPYFANGWIIGDFKTVSSGADYWGPMPDPFDPEFKRRAEATVAVIAEEVKGNPWCVGVFIDNEKAWGNEKSTRSRFGIVIHTLTRDASDSPTKAAWVALLREKYKTIAGLNDAWQTNVASWEDFARGFAKLEAYDNRAMLADFSELLELYAEAYFKTVHDALAEVMPNHLYLGCRMTPWGMTRETRRAAARYADVMSYNFYREALGTHNWTFLDEIDKPSIIGEFHMGTTDGGMPHAGLIHAQDQADRGRMFHTYMNSVIDNPYFVGAHWFQYIDSPMTGRAHDGENYNVGFVTVADVPYKQLVDSARELNRSLYPRRFGDLAKPAE
ncbi:MAG: beta-galactosidase [Planctomycetota bacterium]